MGDLSSLSSHAKKTQYLLGELKVTDLRQSEPGQWVKRAASDWLEPAAISKQMLTALHRPTVWLHHSAWRVDQRKNHFAGSVVKCYLSVNIH